jgi:CubicO group peptidase (beta-lactamase class C family)
MKNKKLKLPYLIIFFLFFSSMITNGQNDNTFYKSKLIEDYKSFVTNRMQKDSLIGVGIALIIDDSVIWKEGFGYADKENQIPFTTKTTLSLGSVTKTFTALGIMQLQERGLINIDKPLIDYFPQFSLKTRNTDIREITVKSVINHTSGIPNDIFVSEEKDKYTSTVDYLKNEYLGYPPNTISHYSNVGYCLLGHTIFNVSGQDYPDYIQKNILSPIGMNNSGFIDFQKLTNVSKTYDKCGKYHPLQEGRNLPAGSLYSNIDDMAKLAQELIAIYNGKQGSIIRSETLKKIFSVQDNEAILDNDKKGIGWPIFKNDSCFAIWFTGSNHVSNAGIIIVPEKKMAAIFLINTVGGINLAVDGMNKFLKIVGLEQNDYFRKNIARIRNTEPVDISIDSLKVHLGLYADTRSVIQIKPENGKLILTANFGRYILYPVTKNEFTFGKIHNSDSIQFFPKERFLFKEIKGHHFLFWEDENYGLHNCCFLLKQQTIDETWKKRLGKYKVTSSAIDGYDIFSEVELSISENNLLQLKIAYTSGQYAYNMYIESDRELIFCGFGETGGETVSFSKENKNDLMTLFGLTLKKID